MKLKIKTLAGLGALGVAVSCGGPIDSAQLDGQKAFVEPTAQPVSQDATLKSIHPRESAPPPEPADKFGISKEGFIQLFRSQQEAGVCYREPSILRAGDFVVVVGGKRRGAPPDATGTGTFKPTRLYRMQIVSPSACADEAFITPVARIAKIERDISGRILAPEKLRWSPEIEVIDINQYLKAATTPASKFFEPSLYDYMKRVQFSKFNYANGYLGCHTDVDGKDCDTIRKCSAGVNVVKDRLCAAIANKNLFEDYLIRDHNQSLASIPSWLLVPSNARNLVGLRFGAQAAAGFTVDNSAWMSLNGIIAFATVPHGASNNNLDADIVQKHGALRVNISELWRRYGSSDIKRPVALGISDQALDWRENFHAEVMKKSIDYVTAWAATPVGSEQIARFERSVASDSKLTEAVFLKETAGLNYTVALPRTYPEIIQNIRWYAASSDPFHRLNELGVSEEYARIAVDIKEWVRSIVAVYEDAQMYPELSRSRDLKTYVDSHLKNVDNPTFALVKDAHAKLGIPLSRQASIAVESASSTALAAVISVYARQLNSRISHYSRWLQFAGLDETPTGTRLDRLFFRSSRIGPGNALVLPALKRVFLPVAGGFMITTDYTLQQIDTAYDDTSIRNGTERAVAIIGKSPETRDYKLFMTLRSLLIRPAKSDANGNLLPFDLALWSRNLSMSKDSGKTWTGDSVLPPSQFDCSPEAETAPLTPAGYPPCEKFVKDGKLKIMVDSQQGGDYLIERSPETGFKSTRVQASVTSIPGFFGKGIPLVLHGHPSTSDKAIAVVDGKPKIVTCLGDSPSDASKDDKIVCDFRFNFQVTPGVPVQREASSGADAVKWAFDSKIIIHPGSAGYSSAAFLGREGCSAALAGFTYEGTDNLTLIEDRGFNNGINLQFIRAKGGDFSHLDNCNTVGLDHNLDF